MAGDLSGFALLPGTSCTDAEIDALVEFLRDSPRRWSLKALKNGGEAVYMTLDATNASTMDTLRRLLTVEWWSPVEPGLEPGIEQSWGSGPSYLMRNARDPPIRMSLVEVVSGQRPRDNRAVAHLNFRLVGEAEHLDMSRYQL